jgi:hypothetical protein
MVISRGKQCLRFRALKSKSKMVHTPLGPNRYQRLIRVLIQKKRRGKSINDQTEDDGSRLRIESIELDVSPYSLIVASIRSPETKKKYLQRTRYFFDYLNILQDDPEECFEVLTRKANMRIIVAKCEDLTPPAVLPGVRQVKDDNADED